MNTCYDIHESGLKSNILWVSNGRKVMYGGELQAHLSQCSVYKGKYICFALICDCILVGDCILVQDYCNHLFTA